MVAGITVATIAGTQTGVYVGAAQIDYTNILFKDVDEVPIYQSTGTGANILSNRISYVFDLKGASITMDTACSSSLAALHVACQSLRTEENTQVIVCGSHIMLSPDTMVGLSMLRYGTCPTQAHPGRLMEEGCLEKKEFPTRMTPEAQDMAVAKALLA